MSLTLFKREIKRNFLLFLIFIAVLTMYGLMIVAMYEPGLGNSLEEMAKSMPQIFDAFGMGNVPTSLIDFIINYLYGFIFLVFPLIFTIVISNRLLTRYLDNGSMVYLLASGQKRLTIIRTQALLLFLSYLAFVIYLTALLSLSSQLFFPKEVILVDLLKINTGLLGLYLFFGAISFLIAASCNESKKTLALSSTFIVYSLLLQMLSQVGQRFENVKYFSPLTLFQAKDLMADKGSAWLGIGILYLIACLAFLLAFKIFKEKDLPL